MAKRRMVNAASKTETDDTVKLHQKPSKKAKRKIERSDNANGEENKSVTEVMEEEAKGSKADFVEKATGSGKDAHNEDEENDEVVRKRPRGRPRKVIANAEKLDEKSWAKRGRKTGVEQTSEQDAVPAEVAKETSKPSDIGKGGAARSGKKGLESIPLAVGEADAGKNAEVNVEMKPEAEEAQTGQGKCVSTNGAKMEEKKPENRKSSRTKGAKVIEKKVTIAPQKRGRKPAKKAYVDLQDEELEAAVKAKNLKSTVAKKKTRLEEKSEALDTAGPSGKKVKHDKETKESEHRLANSSMKTIKIISWNVAGIRAWIKKKAHLILKKESPDLFGLQEIKCTSLPGQMDVKGYHHYLESPLDKVGHSGVLLLTKQQPAELTYGSKLYEDARGRMIIAEFENFYFINTYVPNSGRGLVNLEKRKRWEDWFIEEIKKLDGKKPVIYAGDLNVAHNEIDLANPKPNRNKTAGFTDQERDDFTRLLGEGFVDVFRELNPDKKGAYTFWSIMHNARPNNIGWRLDYFVVSKRLFDKVKRCEILSDVTGSDHCPILMEIEV